MKERRVCSRRTIYLRREEMACLMLQFQDSTLLNYIFKNRAPFASLNYESINLGGRRFEVFLVENPGFETSSLTWVGYEDLGGFIVE
jgi:hypothetical protein